MIDGVIDVGFGVVYFYWVVKLATNFKRIITGFGVV